MESPDCDAVRRTVSSPLLGLITVVLTLIGYGEACANASSTPDFGTSVSVSPVSINVGSTRPPMTIALSTWNGFTGPVSIELRRATFFGRVLKI